jgi:hypothetical protein
MRRESRQRKFPGARVPQARHRLERKERLAIRVPGRGLYPIRPHRHRNRRRWPPQRHQRNNRKEQRLHHRPRDNRSPSTQWKHERGAELEASDRAWGAQGKRIRVWPVVTLPKPEIVIFFLHGGFFPPANSAGSMAQRDNSRIDLHQSAAGPTGRCPVQSSTPLGPDQVNVLLFPFPMCECLRPRDHLSKCNPAICHRSRAVIRLRGVPDTTNSPTGLLAMCLL